MSPPITTPEHDHRFDLFGTQVRLLVAGPSPLDAQVAAARVQARLQRLHRLLTRFDPASELSRLNAAAGIEAEVSETLLGAVQDALEAARRSRGLVDPTVVDLLERAGYGASRAGVAPAPLAEALAAAPARRTALARPGAAWRRIAVDPAARRVRLPAGVRLDLGGTAKGRAVDVAAAMLATQPSFAVDAGGDLRLGGRDAQARTVEIAHPLHDGVAHRFELAAGAVATSGLRTRIWRTPGGFAHHLIDPGRGRPAWTGVIQATALAPTALEAETLAKTALLRGPAAGRSLLAARGGALVLDDGSVLLAGPLGEPAPRAEERAA
ncbi:FAD:protein FMN transferase [Capillimicrobium parvum]|uniref:FAD:protein FMN transferase n=1 Tax=Capillimicrobium parvum TaxID=2884022 RepID=A0A9E6Y4N7_9ACTN|nr:FAD:protein FMN transferase [Capillimicrobium parvum]UGS38963.1 FAD:protein FMN transferase [Capillimicrobium parvum]